MPTQVIHIRNAPPGWKDNPDYVYIGRGRGSIWGNPFRVEDYGRGRCIEEFEKYLLRSPELLKSLPELKGKTLICFCKPAGCHGDILKKHAENS